MLYDISFLWIWLILALLLGGAVGWRTEAPGAQGPWFVGWFQWAVIALVVALIVSIFPILPGGLGFWLETAVLFFLAYLIGCLAGGALQRFRNAA